MKIVLSILITIYLLWSLLSAIFEADWENNDYIPKVMRITNIINKFVFLIIIFGGLFMLIFNIIINII